MRKFFFLSCQNDRLLFYRLFFTTCCFFICVRAFCNLKNANIHLQHFSQSSVTVSHLIIHLVFYCIYEGLVLQLNIESEQYLGELSEEAGVRVALHEPGAMPFPPEEGFSVGPGMATSVGLTKVGLEAPATAPLPCRFNSVDLTSTINACIVVYASTPLIRALHVNFLSVWN